MKKIALLACCALALSLFTFSCAKEEPAAPPPKPAAKAPAVDQALLAEAGKLGGIQGSLDKLIDSVVPDKQQKALIIARENVEKLSLVITYEAQNPGKNREAGLGLMNKYRQNLKAVSPEIFNEDGLALIRQADAVAAAAVRIMG